MQDRSTIMCNTSSQFHAGCFVNCNSAPPIAFKGPMNNRSMIKPNVFDLDFFFKNLALHTQRQQTSFLFRRPKVLLSLFGYYSSGDFEFVRPSENIKNIDYDKVRIRY